MADNGKSEASDPTPEPHSQENSQSLLDELVAQATAKYAQKEYSEAAELYSKATELQSHLNGELSPLNADLLFCYGRCLYQVALLNSDILGSRVAQEAVSGTAPSNDRLKDTAAGRYPVETSQGDPYPQNGDADAAEAPRNFQFLGDEESDASDGEEKDDDGAEATGEEDEFSNAFEILDLARILLLKRLEELPANPEVSESTSLTRRLQERLADTYDLQAEISLEGERFSDAAKDLKAALDLKARLYPSHSNVVAETHYKLSLALEFAAVSPQQADRGDHHSTGNANPNEAMRKEAAEHMRAAIDSCEGRIRLEEESISRGSTKEVKEVRRSIDEVRDMVHDMQQRVHTPALEYAALS